MSGRQRKEIPYWISDGVSFLAGILSIISSISGIFNIERSITKLPDGNYVVNYNGWLICIMFALVFFLIVVFFQMRKYGKLLQKLRKSVAGNYYLFLHDFRDQYFDMIKTHKIETKASVEYQRENITKDTKTFLEKALDYLCTIIGESCNAEISGCIKVIDNVGGDGTEIQLNEARVRTFCRSKNTNGERTANDLFKGKSVDSNNAYANKSVPIIDNTDFCEIITGEISSCFYQRDLLDYKEKLEEAGKEYKNSTRNFDKYYRGTIVAPIRIARERLYYVECNDNFDVIGFLCIDTMSTNAFREKEKKYYCDIVKAFAAEMYVVLNKYNYYLKKLEVE